jgi:hypothetical protein
LLNQIQDVIHNLAVDQNIAFVWVPGHSNNQGNETADKAVTNLQMPSDLKMNTCDLKSKIKKESNMAKSMGTNNQSYVKYQTNYETMRIYQSIQPKSSSCDHQNETNER